jgi:hypothetical protein
MTISVDNYGSRLVFSSEADENLGTLFENAEAGNILFSTLGKMNAQDHGLSREAIGAVTKSIEVVCKAVEILHIIILQNGVGEASSSIAKTLPQQLEAGEQSVLPQAPRVFKQSASLRGRHLLASL